MPSLPDSGELSNPQFSKLPGELQPFVKARTRQSLAHEVHFGAGSMQNYLGNCAGVATVWMRMHHARPDADAVSRVNTTMSFEGMTHAQIYQQSYAAEFANPDLRKESRAAHHALAQQPLDEHFGIVKKWSDKQKLNAGQMSQAMEELQGYASVGWVGRYADGRRSDHQVAMFRDSQKDRITFFDATLGEFELPSQKAHQFLLGLEKMRAGEVKNGFKFESFHIHHVSMSAPIEATPLAAMTEDLNRRTSPHRGGAGG